MINLYDMKYNHFASYFVDLFKLHTIFPSAITSLDEGVKSINYGVDPCLEFSIANEKIMDLLRI